MATPSTRSTGNWSSPNKGLAARLLAEPEDLQSGLRCAITLELRNGRSEPLVVTNQPDMVARLNDASGAPTSPAALLVSGPFRPEQWAVIPGEARLAFRVDLQTLGAPTREQGVVLVALGNQGWMVGQGSYLLEATMSVRKKDHGPPDQWIGELALPAVAIEVPASLFAVN